MHQSAARRVLSFLTLATLFLALIASFPAHADYRGDLLGDLSDLEGKIVGLAEAIPEDQYSWRPSEGVRSVSEALMHTATANYFFPSRLGTQPPEGVNLGGLESITAKDEVVKTLKASFAHLRGAIEGLSDDRLSEDIDTFGGQKATISGFLHFALSHCHEHLGQMIAYARSVGVTPPWSGGN